MYLQQSNTTVKYKVHIAYIKNSISCMLRTTRADLSKPQLLGGGRESAGSVDYGWYALERVPRNPWVCRLKQGVVCMQKHFAGYARGGRGKRRNACKVAPRGVLRSAESRHHWCQSQRRTCKCFPLNKYSMLYKSQQESIAMR